MHWIWFALCIGGVRALVCDCGRTNQTLFNNKQFNTCFIANTVVDRFCSKARVRLTNLPAIPALCLRSVVGLGSLACTGWFISPDPDLVSMRVYLCNLESVRFQSCTDDNLADPTTFRGDVIAPTSIQPQLPGDNSLWSSGTQCRDPVCPESVATQPNIYNRVRGNTSYTICNRAYDMGNTCNALTGACTCSVFMDNTQAFTGNACQFEKGKGNCCYDLTQADIVTPCCPAVTPYGACATIPTRVMCGTQAQSRSDRCISADGVSTPTCQLQLTNSTTNATFLVPNCPSGSTCPGDARIPNNTACRAHLASDPCACQCSLCYPTCNTNKVGFAGVCQELPTLGCSCVVPGAICVDQVGSNTCNNPSIDCSTTDLCGGPTCTEKVNNCRTQVPCDTTILWRFNVAHPCVCNGNGLCNLDANECECFDQFGEVGPQPLFAKSTRCATPNSCLHCNSNPSLPPPAPSTCQIFEGFPDAFNCSCRPYWYTTGFVQTVPVRNTETPLSPIFQCTTPSCIGFYSQRNIQFVNQTLPSERLYVNLTTGKCVCPNGTTAYRDQVLLRDYCIVNPAISPLNGLLCGIDAPQVFSFMQIKVVPSELFSITSNVFNYTDDDFPLATNASVGGPSLCNCDAFFNATYVKGSWYAPTGTWCSTWCFPSNVTFVIDTSSGVTRRTCTNCWEFGYGTMTDLSGNSQCNGTLCQHESIWDMQAQRCNCTVWPYNINFPEDPHCTQSWCFPYSAPLMTGFCTCPPVVTITATTHPVDNGYPNTIPGCANNCSHGGTPNPQNGYQNCTCVSQLFSGRQCQIIDCKNGGVPVENPPQCICPFAFGGIACEIPLCVFGHASPDGSQCICDNTVLWIGGTAGYCNITYCTLYAVGQFRPLTPFFFFDSLQPNETEVMTLDYAGLPVGVTTTCACTTTQFTKQVISGFNACAVRVCKDDQDIVIDVEGGSFCRCSCPSLLLTNGPLTVAPVGLAGCGVSFVNPSFFQTVSLNNECPGFLPTEDHMGWSPQCWPSLVGYNCSGSLCNSRQQFNPVTMGCDCLGNFVGANCTVCPLTPPERVNVVDCTCAGVLQMGTVCTNETIPCDPMVSPICPPPPGTADIPQPITESSPTLEWWMILIIALIATGVLVVVIYFSIDQSKQAKKAAEEEAILKEGESPAPPAQPDPVLTLTPSTPAAETTSETASLIQSAAPKAKPHSYVVTTKRSMENRSLF